MYSGECWLPAPGARADVCLRSSAKPATSKSCAPTAEMEREPMTLTAGGTPPPIALNRLSNIPQQRVGHRRRQVVEEVWSSIVADAQFSNRQQQLKGIVEFMVGGVAAMLEKRRGSLPGRH